MGVSKVNYGNETIIDLTEDTITPDDLAFGATAHDASGERIQGRDATNAYVTFEESASLGNIVSGERMGVLFGKLKKWFSNLGGTSISLTNNLLATVAGTALDAVQGKILKDEITELNDKVNGNILTYNESEDAYYIQHGADAVPKKLGNSGVCEYGSSTIAIKAEGGGNATINFKKSYSSVHIFIKMDLQNAWSYRISYIENANKQITGFNMSGRSYYSADRTLPFEWIALEELPNN